MKSIIAAVITCSVLFGASYWASSYFAQMTPDEDTEKVEPMPDSADQKSSLPPNGDTINQVPAMQVSHRPEESVSLEAVLQMSDSIKKMEEKLIIREERLAKEEQRVKMLFSDLNTEQDELQAFSEGVDSKIETLERLADNLRNVLAQLNERKTELVALEKEAGVDEESQRAEIDDKVNDVKGWFSNLEPTQAADYLKEFANTGDLEFAASLLHKMPDRQKTKILTELRDPVLVRQLIDALEVAPKKPKK